MKNIILILILITLSNCGYQSIYKNNDNQKFKIVLEEMNGDMSINNLLKSNLKRYSSNISEEIYFVQTEAYFNRSILAKDKTGKATDIKLNVSVKFMVKYNDKATNFTLEESLNIDNSLDPYEQNNYENIIKTNFVNTIIKTFVLKINTL